MEEDTLHYGESENWSKKWRNLLDGKGKSIFYYTEKKPRNYQELRHKEIFNILREIIIKNFGERKNIKCLEVGSGRGTMSLYFSKHFGLIPYVTDVEDSALELAKANFLKFKSEGIFEKQDVCSLSYPDNTFDIVMTFGLLEHFTDIEKPLREMVRVLKNGGLLFSLNVPQKEHIQHKLRLLFLILSKMREIIKSIIYLSAKSSGLEYAEKGSKKRIYKNNYPRQFYEEKARDTGLVKVVAIPINNIIIFNKSPKIFNRVLYSSYHLYYSFGRKVFKRNFFISSDKLSREHLLIGIKE